jgi:hypothetical protein
VLWFKRYLREPVQYHYIAVVAITAGYSVKTVGDHVEGIGNGIVRHSFLLIQFCPVVAGPDMDNLRFLISIAFLATDYIKMPY